MYCYHMQREKSSSWLIVYLTVLLFFFSYGNQLIYRYSVPAGYDPLAHNNIIQQILSGHYQIIYQYHTAWHLPVALLSRLFHADSLLVMAWLGPLLLIAMGLSLYHFNSRFFGYGAGIASLILITFFSLQPFQTYSDGGFPNILAAGTVLPFFVILLNQAFEAKQKFWPIIWTILGLFLLAFSHHLTTLYTVGILFFFFIVLLFRAGRKRHVNGLVLLLGVLVILGIGILLLKLFLMSPITGSVKSLAALFVRVDASFPFVHFIGLPDGPDALWPWRLYNADIGQAVVVLGGSGLLISLAIMLTQPNHPYWRIHALLVVWTITLLVGSRFPNLSDPGRLARDMAIPLALLGGMALQYIYEFIKEKQISKSLFYLFMVLCIINGWPALLKRVNGVFRPNYLVAHLPVDVRSADYITQNLPPDARIMSFQEDMYLDYFTPNQKVDWIIDPKKVSSIVTYTHPEGALESYDYLYLEERYNKPKGFLNNPDITKNYLDSLVNVGIKEVAS